MTVDAPVFPSAVARMGDRSLFPSLHARVYLNHGGISPPSLPVQNAVKMVLEDYAANGAGAWSRWSAQRRRLKERLARMLNTVPEQLAFEPNTTRGVTDIALSFAWEKGDRVLLFQGEFPANITPWMQASKLHGLQPRFLSLRPFEEEQAKGLAMVEDALREGVRLLAVSAVQFQTGLRMPLAELSRLCRKYGTRIFVDGVQAIGAVPLDVQQLQIDFLACGSHKWLLGLEGAGFLYVRPERMEELRPHTAGWLSYHDAVRFLFDGKGHLRYDLPLRESPDVFEGANYNTAGLAGLEASVALLEQHDAAVRYAHIERYLDVLQEGLEARGFRSARSSRREEQSGILSVEPPGKEPVARWSKGLSDRGVACATPDGWLRFTPHWPNAHAEISYVLDAIDEVKNELLG